MPLHSRQLPAMAAPLLLVLLLALASCAPSQAADSPPTLQPRRVLKQINGLRILYYDMNVTIGRGAPDCVTRDLILVNGMFQPSIMVQVNDTLVVTVNNQIPADFPQTSSGITIHWHGLYMWNAAAWYDGTSYGTMCPIAPGANFTYRFLVDEAPGTYLWHDHATANRANGLQGALIIDNPNITTPYTPNENEFVMFISDWYHDEGNIMAMRLNRPADPSKATNTSGLYESVPVPDSILISGRGRYDDCSNNSALAQRSADGTILPLCTPKAHPVVGADVDATTGGCSHSVYDVAAGSTYLFRIINSATSSYFTVCFENHTVTMIAADATPTSMDDYTYPDCIDVNSGQRYDVQLTADAGAAPGTSFWISVHSQGRSMSPSGYAIMQYTAALPAYGRRRSVLAKGSLRHHRHARHDRPRNHLQAASLAQSADSVKATAGADAPAAADRLPTFRRGLSHAAAEVQGLLPKLGPLPQAQAHTQVHTQAQVHAHTSSSSSSQAGSSSHRRRGLFQTLPSNPQKNFQQQQQRQEGQHGRHGLHGQQRQLSQADWANSPSPGAYTSPSYSPPSDGASSPPSSSHNYPPPLPPGAGFIVGGSGDYGAGAPPSDGASSPPSSPTSPSDGASSPPSASWNYPPPLPAGAGFIVGGTGDYGGGDYGGEYGGNYHPSPPSPAPRPPLPPAPMPIWPVSEAPQGAESWTLDEAAEVVTHDGVLGYLDNYIFQAYWQQYSSVGGQDYFAGVLYSTPNKTITMNITNPTMTDNGMVRWAINNVAMPVDPPCTAMMRDISTNPGWLSRNALNSSNLTALQRANAVAAADSSRVDGMTTKHTAPSVFIDGEPAPMIPIVGKHVAVVAMNEIIDIIINNRPANENNPNSSSSSTMTVQHPMHMHGHKFWVLGTGTGVYNASDNPYLNVYNAMLRDTLTLPVGSWAYIRFTANNPGLWPFHCHIMWHQFMGQQMYFLEAMDQWPRPPTNFPHCNSTCKYNFAGYSTTYINNTYGASQYQLP